MGSLLLYSPVSRTELSKVLLHQVTCQNVYRSQVRMSLPMYDYLNNLVNSFDFASYHVKIY
jgi:hypothetical protein